jgi:hypothetical protein
MKFKKILRIQPMYKKREKEEKGDEKQNRVSRIKFAEMDTAAVHRGDDI